MDGQTDNFAESVEKEPVIMPTIGRMVHYKLSKEDAEVINKRRYDAQQNMEKIKADSLGYVAHVGNEAIEGQILPMTVTVVHSEDLINGQVFLDGNDNFWALSAVRGVENGQWDWMPYQKGQAKKTEEAESKSNEIQDKSFEEEKTPSEEYADAPVGEEGEKTRTEATEKATEEAEA